jgi:hypothetical protein
MGVQHGYCALASEVDTNSEKKMFRNFTSVRAMSEESKRERLGSSGRG